MRHASSHGATEPWSVCTNVSAAPSLLLLERIAIGQASRWHALRRSMSYRPVDRSQIDVSLAHAPSAICLVNVRKGDPLIVRGRRWCDGGGGSVIADAIAGTEKPRVLFGCRKGRLEAPEACKPVARHKGDEERFAHLKRRIILRGSASKGGGGVQYCNRSCGGEGDAGHNGGFRLAAPVFGYGLAYDCDAGLPTF